jgi:hypothetical protein
MLIKELRPMLRRRLRSKRCRRVITCIHLPPKREAPPGNVTTTRNVCALCVVSRDYCLGQIVAQGSPQPKIPQPHRDQSFFAEDARQEPREAVRRVTRDTRLAARAVRAAAGDLSYRRFRQAKVRRLSRATNNNASVPGSGAGIPMALAALGEEPAMGGKPACANHRSRSRPLTSPS